jgi:hypothetical protein
MFPPNGSAIRRPLPSTGSPRVEFPGFVGDYEALRHPTDRPPALRDCFAWPYHPVRLSALRSGPTPAWGQGPSGLAVPSRQLLSRWSRRVSQVPREPSWTYAVFSDPGRTGRTSPVTVHRCCPRCVNDEGSSG